MASSSKGRIFCFLSLCLDYKSMMTMKAEGKPIEYLYNVFEVHLGVYVSQFSTGRHHTAVDRL